MAEHQSTSDPAEQAMWPLVVWAARCSVYLLAQGALVLLAYAYYGFDTDPESFALGFRIDPILAMVNLAWGVAGTFFGFFRPRYALPFVLALAAFYTALAVLGSFTAVDLGMMLIGRVNRFNWLVAIAAWGVGLYTLWRKPRTH
jgi:hypothetical protein